MGFSDKAVYKRKVLFPQREKYPFDSLVRLEFPRVVDNINKPCLILRETISLKKMARKRLMDRWGFFCYFWINQNCKCVLWIHFSNSILSTPLEVARDEGSLSVCPLFFLHQVERKEGKKPDEKPLLWDLILLQNLKLMSLRNTLWGFFLLNIYLTFYNFIRRSLSMCLSRAIA